MIFSDFTEVAVGTLPRRKRDGTAPPPPVATPLVQENGASTLRTGSPQPTAELPPGVCHRFFLHGTCNDQQCRFVHTRCSTRSAEDDHSNAPKVCHNFLKNKQCSRIRCPYRHSLDDDFDSSRPLAVETLPTRSRESSGQHPSSSYPSRSPRRENERTNHYAEQTREPRTFGSPNKLCWNYQQGYCQFGQQCAFSHDIDRARRGREQR
jgi:hypothetical protein